MAINLEKNKDKLKRAWQDVLDDKSTTNWAVFGYEGHSNDLTVVSQGSRGIEEMTEDLSSGAIMYAFVKVIDPTTTLPKFVLINWQGEAANIVRKGTCANHLRDVANFFHGAHVSVTARNEDEVEPQLIIDKVARCSASSYSFKSSGRDVKDDGNKSVGTNYQKVNPTKEINSSERNKFWLREEEEEKKRVEEERKKKDEQRQRLQEDIKKQKANFPVNDDKPQVKKPTVASEIAQLRNATTKQETSETDDENKGELLRKQRNEEAQMLIGKSTTHARSIFEQNTATGQLYVPSKPARTSVGRKSNYFEHTNGENGTQENEINQEPPKNGQNVLQNGQRNNVEERSVPNEEDNVAKQIENVQITTSVEIERRNQISMVESKDHEPIDDDDEQFSTIKRSPKTPLSDTRLKPAAEENASLDDPILIEETEIIRQLSAQSADDVLFDGDLGLKARALYDYQAADETEITFDPGDIITHIDRIDEGWWQGFGPDGTYGLFPANYVELIDEL